MRIKKLDICGFKSFADRARLHFGDGVTGVVGPNGCGKSNVVDAIRWVMGEMSAKHLRGRGMQDVIFAGAAGRAPQGMAEVTLTFDNDGNVPPAYLSYGEIAVTRRLFRDGTSEYLINKSPVRLRDITDLFLGTGVGTRAYSIIEQGRIAFVVNSRPEERRSLIEEVAGITKFKVRKKAAERRIESTQQNLARVGDVVAELDRQLVTLRKQAKKAEAYRDLKARLREHELHAAVAELLRLHVTREAGAVELARLDASLGDQARSAEADESALEARRLALLEQEQALAGLQAASAAQAARLGGLQRDLTHWQQQATLARASAERATQDAAEAENNLAANACELDRLAAAIEEHEASCSEHTVDFDGAGMRVDEARETLAAVDDELSSARREAMAQLQGAVQQRAALDALQRQRHDREVELQRRQQEAHALAPEAAAAAVREGELHGELATAEARLEVLRTAQQAAQAALPDARAARAEGQARARVAADVLAVHAGRLTSLEQIVQRLEGYGDGVRRLYGDAGPRLAGVVALVAEVLAVPPQHERAVEAALGERLQYLVVDGPQVAERGIAALVAAGGGRSGFVPEHLPAPDAGAAIAVPRGDGVLGLAAELVDCAEEHRGLAHALLGRTVLVQDLATARAQAERVASTSAAAAPWRFVTAAGETVDAGPIVAGGAADDAGLLATRREVRELQDEVARGTAARDAADAAVRAADDALTALEAELGQLGREAHTVELSALEARKNLEAVRHARGRHEARLGELRGQLTALDGELEQLLAQEQASAEAAQAAELGRDEGAWRLEELEERRQVHAGQLAEAQEALVALRVQQAQAEERGRALVQARARLQQSAPQLTARIARARELAVEVERSLAELTAQQQRGEADLSGFAADAEAARQDHDGARQAYEAAQQALLNDEQAIKAARRGASELQEALVQGRMQQQKLELAQHNLVAQVQERYDVALHQAVDDYHDRALPGPEARRARQEMERELRAMGAVNLTAIEECAEVEGRFCFLSGQQQDLEQALAALQEAILRINKTSRERFQQAFDAVNQTFQQVYPRLFHGGSARLELLAADDLLECGVDIIAMPPGKKLQNVNLLSGGEKALTATALVFAIFLIKPSPFCILDEVDAPLDEANVGRFNEMLREISKVSQFSVITHNKQTMLQMDRLYGITMEDAGMSKVVAVDLHNRRDERAA